MLPTPIAPPTPVAADLRGLARRWPLPVALAFAALVLIALAGRALLPINADLYLRYIYFDPQGAEQVLDGYRTDVRAVYTSGLGIAAAVAVIAGAYLGLRAPRPLTEPTVVVARAVTAAVVGTVFALVDLAAVLPDARRHLAGHSALSQLHGYGVPVPSDRPIGTVLCAALCVPLAAVVGVGVTVTARWRWLAGGFAVLPLVGTLAVLGTYELTAPDGVKMALFFVGVATVPYAYLIVDGEAAAVTVIMTVIAACALLAAALAARRRL
jgi:hypothetical protein